MKCSIVLFLILVLATVSHAQKAVLTGTIYDANGAVVPNARVKATNFKGESVISASDSEGVFILELKFNRYDSTVRNFKIEKYKIVVTQENGFATAVIESFAFVPSYKGTMILDIALDVRDGEPCGYEGADCLRVDRIEEKETPVLSSRIVSRLPVYSESTVIRGKITDLYGQSLQQFGVLTVVGKSGETFSARTDESGSYYLRLPLGLYRLEVKSDGFCPQVRDMDLVGNGKDEIKVDFSLLYGRTANAPCERRK